MLRAGPFSDERIIRLVNRRFVPFFFDLSDRGAAADKDARVFVTAERKELAGSQVPTPPVLLMTASGQVLGEVSNYATEDDMLKALLAVLEKHPEFARPSPHERLLLGSVAAHGLLLMDLQKYDEAAKVLARANSEAAHFVAGRLARLRRNWVRMKKHLAQVKHPGFADDVVMESAYEYWHEGRWEDLMKHLKDFPEDSDRYTEARYYLGLGLYQAGRVDDALALWKSMIETCSQDRWIYRADWAYTNVKEGRRGGRRVFTTRGPKTSLLDRHGYMGRRNPDLAPRRKPVTTGD